MKKLIGGVFALFLLIFLSACPVEYPGPGGSGSSGARVGFPTITGIPPVNYSNAPIQITFDSSTPDAVFYYTLDGSLPSPDTGNRFNGPFLFLEPNNNTTPRPGHVQVRVIATREGMTNSIVTNRDFQVFETVPASGWNNATTEIHFGTGQGFSGAISVGIRLENGVIDSANAIIQSNDSADFLIIAENHARAFWTQMNHWDFDTRTTATVTSAGIREAARQALVAAGVIQN